jgi:hypothetical protein
LTAKDNGSTIARQDVTMTGASRGKLRVVRAKAHLGSLRGEIDGWFATRANDARFARFTAHFETLAEFLSRLLNTIEGRLTKLECAPPASSGEAYERCRAAEQSMTIVWRTFAWYADKYEQRERDPNAEALRAGDEIVRSCWTEPFAALGRLPPSGPLAYLEPRFDAFATPRVSLPPDLRAPGDELIGDIIKELPIPTIALPVSCPDEPWWLVLAAHETGHHIQKDLVPGLENATREALEQAVAGLPGGQELALAWRRWALECFADAFSVAMVGPAAAWAVDELQHAADSRLLRVPTFEDRYPPPIVRLALLGELSRCLGLADLPFDAKAALAWLSELPSDAGLQAGRAAAEPHIRAAPTVAQALLDLPIDGRHSLLQVCGWDGERFAETGVTGRWAAQLPKGSPVITPRTKRWSARVAISSGVSAYMQMANGESQQRLRQNLTAILATCGEPGVLAAGSPAGDVAAIADRFAERLPDAGNGGS